MEKMYDDLHGFYPLSKTLRFELKPIGNTLNSLKQNGIIEDDEHRAESYKKAKKLIDEYHKYFINECLKNFKLDKTNIELYYSIITKKEKNHDEIKKVESELRKEIANNFKKNKSYKELFGKELINKCLPLFTSKTEDSKILDEFKKFTIYFKGFNDNRKNMYSDEEKSTAISYRLINENLRIFINNMESFKYIKQALGYDVLNKIYKELESIIQVNELGDMFELEYYNDVLTQTGIEIYNQIIGGIASKDGTKIKGINEYINEYEQKNPNDKKIAKLDILYKQILSDTTTASFQIESFETDNEVILAINETSNIINKDIIKLKDILKNIASYDLSKIYIQNNLALTEISKQIYDDWNEINQCLRDWYDNNIGKDKNSKNYEEQRKKYLKSFTNISIKFLNDCTSNIEDKKNIEDYFSNCNICDKVGEEYKNIENLLKEEYPTNKHLKQDEKNIEIIKNYLDSLKELQLFIKPLIGARFDAFLEKDNKFYEDLNKIWDEYSIITQTYNKVRNYLTGKVYSTDKIKLNFKNEKLLSGWAKGNEISYGGLIFKDKEYYYLGIINNEYNKSFKEFPTPKDEKDCFLKMKYLQIADPQKDIQNLMIIDGKTVKKNGKQDIDGINRALENLKNQYLPNDINIIRKNKTYSKLNVNFKKEDLIKFIDFYKARAKEYYSAYNFNFKPSNEYRDFGDFTNDMNSQAYQLSFEKISKEYIDMLVNDGKLYLFKIYNKDFSKFSKGKPNLHTLYWKMLFNNENLKNVIYKLNGEAEIFYRKPSIKYNITHSKNQAIKNKNELNKKKESIFNYDLIKDKRFAEPKFQFHVPIALNFNNCNMENINEIVNEKIKNNKENYIIGIDRGERNLLYLVLIDSNGNIIKQFSLNTIINEYKDNKCITDYHRLLDNKEKEREKEKESWQSIEKIKELKEGYLSQAINIITNLMIEYNAIVVLEDLNFGFMRGRQKVEKQVYQKFEKMLIDKLNFVVKKDKPINDNGGLLKPYQLTNEFKSFKKLGKQSGVLFYIPAWNTSKMDPATGFVNLFYIKYENETKTKEFFDKFDDIIFNKEKNYFEFYIDYDKFTTKAEGTKTKWTICTFGNRIITFRNKDKNENWDNKEINLTDEFNNLFKKYDINTAQNIKQQIMEKSGKEFWSELINLFKLTLQMRNSISATNNNEIDVKDSIISPVKDENGKFFNSDEATSELPQNADANGAYNIARKGLWIVKQIKTTPNDKLKNIKLAITNKEWLKFIQNKEWEN